MSEPTYYDAHRDARDAARDADWWRYPMPGQWIGGEWREWERGDE